eukprot:COSAG01_NODE_2824_length_7006_cov_2.795714_8_plen_323_part_00
MLLFLSSSGCLAWQPVVGQQTTMQAPGGTFIGWDPTRPTKGRMCAQCSQTPATKRCSRCGIAHYCARECQQLHWATHRRMCRGGGTEYIATVEERTRRQAELLQRGGIAREVIALLSEMLTEAQAMGDTEGERHLSMTLAFRCEVAGEAAAAEEAEARNTSGTVAVSVSELQPAPEAECAVAAASNPVNGAAAAVEATVAGRYRVAAAEHRARGQRIERVLGPSPVGKELLSAVNRPGRNSISSSISSSSSSSSSTAGLGAGRGLMPMPRPPASSQQPSNENAMMFGAPTAGDPLGLLSSISLPPPPVMRRTPDSPPGDAPD